MEKVKGIVGIVFALVVELVVMLLYVLVLPAVFWGAGLLIVHIMR